MEPQAELSSPALGVIARIGDKAKAISLKLKAKPKGNPAEREGAPSLPTTVISRLMR